jgi:hypothetical protein
MNPNVELPSDPHNAPTYAKSSFSAIATPAVMRTMKVLRKFLHQFGFLK